MRGNKTISRERCWVTTLGGRAQWTVSWLLCCSFMHRSEVLLVTVICFSKWNRKSAGSPRDSQESSPAHNSKASILQYSAFFTVQLSHPYMTAGKTIALTMGTFVGKTMSLLFNLLSRFVIAFLPGSKHLLISWLQPLSVVSLSSELSILRMVMRILTL